MPTPRPTPRLPHGYSNATWIADGCVGKRYEGVDAAERYAAELAGLRRAAGVVPTAKVVAADPNRYELTFSRLPGRPGQELIDAGYALQVLRAAGWALTRLHHQLPGFVHGDYGPQNLLVDPSAWRVSAVLDWEFCREGDQVTDLAWTEWIVRMHHPRASTALPALFDAYGSRPGWAARHTAMLTRCQELEDLCERRGDPDAVALWRGRTDRTRRWQDTG